MGVLLLEEVVANSGVHSRCPRRANMFRSGPLTLEHTRTALLRSTAAFYGQQLNHHQKGGTLSDSTSNALEVINTLIGRDIMAEPPLVVDNGTGVR